MITDRIFNEDCLKGLASIPDKSIDLAILDPPYYFGDNMGPGGGMLGQRQHAKDIMANLNEPVNTGVLDECLRVLKSPNIYIWCNKTQLGGYISYFEAKGCNTDLLAWHKNNPMPATSNHYLPDTEYCLFFRKNAKLYGDYNSLKKYWVTSSNIEDKKAWGHPTIKPLAIIQQLIKNSSQRGDIVLDPFLGSGTTALACKSLGRHYLGYEINPEYYKIAQARLKTVSVTLADWLAPEGAIQ